MNNSFVERKRSYYNYMLKDKEKIDDLKYELSYNPIKNKNYFYKEKDSNNTLSDTISNNKKETFFVFLSIIKIDDYSDIIGLKNICSKFLNFYLENLNTNWEDLENAQKRILGLILLARYDIKGENINKSITIFLKLLNGKYDFNKEAYLNLERDYIKYDNDLKNWFQMSNQLFGEYKMLLLKFEKNSISKNINLNFNDLYDNNNEEYIQIKIKEKYSLTNDENEELLTSISNIILKLQKYELTGKSSVLYEVFQSWELNNL